MLGLKNVSLLLADNDQATLQILEFYAEKLGWKFVSTTTAEGIINAVNEKCAAGNCFDAIVTDIKYDTGINGITAARAVRKIEPNVPIIFISGYSGSIIREEVRRVQAELFAKPLDYESLFVRIGTLITWYRGAVRPKYDGTERRRNSVNRTEFNRRVKDKALQISSRLKAAIGN